MPLLQMKDYPFVKGVATFWENYLTREGDHYVIYNDAIHEGTVGTMNPILSLGLVWMVMQAISDISALLGAVRIGYNPDSILTHLEAYSKRTYIEASFHQIRVEGAFRE